MYFSQKRERKRRFLKMIYKHWKKAALALTALFWASCEESTSASAITVSQEPGSSSSETFTAGSSETAASSSSENLANSSSSTGISSSSPESGISSANKSESSSSSDFEISVQPLYGVTIEKITCTEDSTASPTPESDSTTTYKCEDGLTCVATETLRWGSLPCSTMETEDGLVEMCPDYGVTAYPELNFSCDDGKVYSEAEFLSRYKAIFKLHIRDNPQDSTIALYGVIQPNEN